MKKLLAELTKLSAEFSQLKYVLRAYVFFKEQCHEADFAVLGQFCAKIIIVL